MTRIQEGRFVCPRCGYIAPRGEKPLTDTSVDIWEAAGRAFWMGKRMTLSELSEESGYSISTVRRHMLRLHGHGLVERVPLRNTPHNNGQGGGESRMDATPRELSARRTYYFYRGSLAKKPL